MSESYTLLHVVKVGAPIADAWVEEVERKPSFPRLTISRWRKRKCHAVTLWPRQLQDEEYRARKAEPRRACLDEGTQCRTMLFFYILLQCPDLDHCVSSSASEVAVHEPELLSRSRVPVQLQRRVLHRRPVVHLDAVFARGGDDLARVELQRGDGVVVPERVGDSTSSEIPDLDQSDKGESARFAIG